MIQVDLASYEAKGIEGVYDLLCLVNRLEIFLEKRVLKHSAGLEPLADTWLSAPGQQ